MHHQHRQRHRPRQQRERVQQADELHVPRPFIDGVQVIGEVEGHALDNIADRDAEQQRRDGAAGEQRPVPCRPPARIVALGAVLERHRPHDEGREDHEHRQVEAREADRIERRPGGEDRAAAEDEPHLVALPDRADGVDGDPAFDIAAPDEGQQRAHPHVEPVGQGKADQQHAKQAPPDHAQQLIA